MWKRIPIFFLSFLFFLTGSSIPCGIGMLTRGRETSIHFIFQNTFQNTDERITVLGPKVTDDNRSLIMHTVTSTRSNNADVPPLNN